MFLERLAELCYLISGKDLEKVPYPLLDPLLKRNGGWAGVSFFLARRKREFKIRQGRARKKVLYGLFALMLAFALWGALEDFQAFVNGFAQNLWADLILLIMILYLLPDKLKDEPRYSVKPFWGTDFLGSGDVVLEIRNVGEGHFLANEILWEIYLPVKWIGNLDIIKHYEGIWEIVEKENPLFSGMVRFYGTNTLPVFERGKLTIATFDGMKMLDLLTSDFQEQQDEDKRAKGYYRLWTSHGYFPQLEDISQDFWKVGMDFDRDPKVGDFFFVEN